MKHKILLGLTGSVASVLYEKLIKDLAQLGTVDVILTERARAFVDLSRITDVLRAYEGGLYQENNEWEWKHGDEYDYQWKKDDPILHITLRDRSSALVIAPCSANTLAKLSNGLCDNLLTSVARAWDMNRPVVIAPAMNTQMWEHPLTEEHIFSMHNFGYKVVDPQEKMLACNSQGMGAMADISKIVEQVRGELTWKFPLDMNACSGIPQKGHPGAFATERKHEHHTGLDLYTNDAAPVSAVETGKVVCIEHFTGEWDNSPWWNNTDCILVEGATGVICYGEIKPRPDLKVGMKVRRGEFIARVVRVLKDGKERSDIPGHSTSMLHLEVYPHGTKRPSNGFEKDILHDPTPFLTKCHDNWKLKELPCKR